MVNNVGGVGTFIVLPSSSDVARSAQRIPLPAGALLVAVACCGILIGVSHLFGILVQTGMGSAATSWECAQPKQSTKVGVF